MTVGGYDCCEACRTPYRPQDLRWTGSRWICRWHWRRIYGR